MAAPLLCALTAVTLSVEPRSSQIHSEEHFIITCPWTVFRSIPSEPTPERCTRPWGVPQETGCRVGPTVPSDSGLYWCQKQNHNQSECSPAANITVSKEKVILESPLFPITEGQQVTLRCSLKITEEAIPTSNFNASFFRNGFFFDRSPGGEVVLPSVSLKDEGLYRCEHPTWGKSLESRLDVKRNDAAPPSVPPMVPPSSAPHPTGISVHRLVSFLVLVLLYTVILCISISIYCKWRRARSEQKQRKSERISLRRIRDA